MQPLAELFRRHLIGPRWKVTQDVLAQHPGSLEEITRVAHEDLQLLIDQLEGRAQATDVRITVEHLVLLLGRLFPVIDSVVADLYMTEIAAEPL